MRLHPQPQSAVTRGEGRLALDAPVTWRADYPIPARLDRALARLGFLRADISHSARLSLSKGAPDMASQGYSLTVNASGIHLSASAEEGCYFGLLTLRQLVAQTEGGLQYLAIEDRPDFAHRGFMLDISRCKVPTMQSLRELIDLLSSLKYNQLQLYTEHTFAYRDHSIVWDEASPLTPEEARELDRYCHELYIELVPNQNSFGHMERWLRHEPYKHLAESPGGFLHPLSGWKDHGSTLKPTKESADFVDALYAELLPNFRSANANIGGDEPWELGQGWSKDLVAKRGKRRVYLDHLKELQSRLRRHGRRMHFWGDILIEEPELATELGADATALLWGYEENHPFADHCAAMSRTGVPFYVVPGTSTWNTIGGRLSNAFPNLLDAATQGARHGARGLLLTEWGDNGHPQSHLLSVPALLYAAQLAWNAADTIRPTSETCSRFVPASLCSADEYAAVLRLSEAADAFAQPLHNGAWLNKILFTPPNEFPAISANIRPQELDEAKSRLNDVRIEGELGLARDLLLFAVAKGDALLSGQEPPTLPAEMLDVYQRHWLARNRPGGLEESLNILKAAQGA